MPLEIVLENPTALVDRAAGNKGVGQGTQSVTAVLNDNLSVEYQLHDIPEIKLYRVRDAGVRNNKEVAKPFELLSNSEHRTKIVHENARKGAVVMKPSAATTGKTVIHKRTLVGAEVTKHMLGSDKTSNAVNVHTTIAAATTVSSSLQPKLNALAEQQHEAMKLATERRQMNTQKYQQRSEAPRKELLHRSNEVRTTLLNSSSNGTKRRYNSDGKDVGGDEHHKSGLSNVMAEQLKQRSREEIIAWALRDTDFYKDNLENSLFQLEAEMKEEALGVEVTVDDLMGNAVVNTAVNATKDAEDIGSRLNVELQRMDGTMRKQLLRRMEAQSILSDKQPSSTNAKKSFLRRGDGTGTHNGNQMTRNNSKGLLRTGRTSSTRRSRTSSIMSRSYRSDRISETASSVAEHKGPIKLVKNEELTELSKRRNAFETQLATDEKMAENFKKTSDIALKAMEANVSISVATGRSVVDRSKMLRDYLELIHRSDVDSSALTDAVVNGQSSEKVPDDNAMLAIAAAAAEVTEPPVPKPAPPSSRGANRPSFQRPSSSRRLLDHQQQLRDQIKSESDPSKQHTQQTVRETNNSFRLKIETETASRIETTQDSLARHNQSLFEDDKKHLHERHSDALEVYQDLHGRRASKLNNSKSPLRSLSPLEQSLASNAPHDAAPQPRNRLRSKVATLLDDDGDSPFAFVDRASKEEEIPADEATIDENTATINTPPKTACTQEKNMNDTTQQVDALDNEATSRHNTVASSVQSVPPTASNTDIVETSSNNRDNEKVTQHKSAVSSLKGAVMKLRAVRAFARGPKVHKNMLRVQLDEVLADEKFALHMGQKNEDDCYRSVQNKILQTVDIFDEKEKQKQAEREQEIRNAGIVAHKAVIDNEQSPMTTKYFVSPIDTLNCVKEQRDMTPVVSQPYRDMDTQRIARETQMKLDKVIGRRQLRGNDIIQSFKGTKIRQMIETDDSSKHSSVILAKRSRKTIARDVKSLSNVADKMAEKSKRTTRQLTSTWKGVFTAKEELLRDATHLLQDKEFYRPAQMKQRQEQLITLDEEQMKRLDRKIIPGTTALTSLEQKKVLNRGSAKTSDGDDGSDIEIGSDEDRHAMHRLKQKLDNFFAVQTESVAESIAKAREKREEAQMKLSKESEVKFLPLTRDSLLKIQYLLSHPNEKFEDDEIRSDYRYVQSYDYQLRQQLEENRLRQAEEDKQTIISAKWFMKLLVKLKKYKLKASSNSKANEVIIPLSIFKLLAVLKQLITLKVHLDKNTILNIIDQSFSTTEYRSNLVYMVIQTVCQVVHIDCEELYNYFKSHNIHVAPQLLLNVKRARKLRKMKSTAAKTSYHSKGGRGKVSPSHGRTGSNKTFITSGIQSSRPAAPPSSAKRLSGSRAAAVSVGTTGGDTKTKKGLGLGTKLGLSVGISAAVIGDRNRGLATIGEEGEEECSDDSEESPRNLKGKEPVSHSESKESSMRNSLSSSQPNTPRARSFASSSAGGVTPRSISALLMNNQSADNFQLSSSTKGSSTDESDNGIEHQMSRASSFASTQESDSSRNSSRDFLDEEVLDGEELTHFDEAAWLQS